ncbi:Uncharacterised protein [Sphingobacterium mizutaii]|uniref:Uncharacterized protein n=1 Tax=Sphingobacterium mizutaii TaxID=1010 RepID=A0AAJ5C052_9SPHI|nr:hypothetical protein SAMN05192578_101525 [Sphingobacterium mizutaii]SNV48896.1 Uncharacterised protein [Sphingobacterium mizutaii]
MIILTFLQLATLLILCIKLRYHRNPEVLLNELIIRFDIEYNLKF